VRDRVECLGLTGLCEAVGPVRGRDIVQLLHECDVLALPSYQEALPMAILEAMAAGLPIVATRVGGIPEVVVDGYNGFLLSPGDIVGLAQRLMILAAEPGLRSLMGRRSREIAAREYDVTPYVERLVTLYEIVIGAGRIPGRLGSHEDSARHHQLPA
jgi:glycosyltransferase involved in cell wall biosynthesis